MSTPTPPTPAPSHARVMLDHKSWLGVTRTNSNALAGGAGAALIIAILTAVERQFPWPASLLPYVPFISAVIDAVIAFIAVTGVPSFSSRDPATPVSAPPSPPTG